MAIVDHCSFKTTKLVAKLVAKLMAASCDEPPTPAGVAAVAGLTVGEERLLLQRQRKVEAGSHVVPGRYYSVFTQYEQVNGTYMSAAELILQFKKGQRHKTRHQHSKQK